MEASFASIGSRRRANRRRMAALSLPAGDSLPLGPFRTCFALADSAWARAKSATSASLSRESRFSPHNSALFR